jgi:hypothetical protein
MTMTLDKVIAGGMVASVLLLIGIWINFEVLVDAYGSGPPYYSRSVNMDKWTNPLPYLIPVDALLIGLVVVALRFSIKNHRSRS